MKSWLRFFGLSFFSDKIAKEARVRGILNCVLGFVLSLIFIYCGVLAANTVPFYGHYNGASQFKEFLSQAVSKTNLTVGGGRVSADAVINTLTDEGAAEYRVNGYNLVVDTRPSTALDDFEAYCLHKDGETRISYEDYLLLSEEEQKNYTFAISYTPDELTLTEELVSSYAEYLSGCGDGDVVKQYEQIVADKDGMTADDYNRKIYALYVKAYYPDITAYERAGEVPLLRSYYYRNYLNTNKIEKTLFIFDDVLFCFYETDGGLSQTLYGYYGKLSDGIVGGGGADAFIKGVFASSVAVSSNVYLMNMVRFIPFIAFVPLILALVACLAFIPLKDKKFGKYTVCLKIAFSWLAVGALISALIMFICGFFVSSNLLNTLPLIIFAAVIAVRTAVFLIGEYIRNARAKAESAAETEENRE